MDEDVDEARLAQLRTIAAEEGEEINATSEAGLRRGIKNFGTPDAIFLVEGCYRAKWVEKRLSIHFLDQHTFKGIQLAP